VAGAHKLGGSAQIRRERQISVGAKLRNSDDAFMRDPHCEVMLSGRTSHTRVESISFSVPDWICGHCDLFYPLGWGSDWVYHKLGNSPVLWSGTGSWVLSGSSGVRHLLSPVIRLGLRNPRKKKERVI